MRSKVTLWVGIFLGCSLPVGCASMHHHHKGECCNPAARCPNGTCSGITPCNACQSASDAPPMMNLSKDAETKSPIDLQRLKEVRTGHAPDFGWVGGELFYVHAQGGLWVLRYAPLNTEDANGGSVVVARDVRMENYREGDLVILRGKILNPKSSIYLGAPLYKASDIELVERAQKE